jgi:hypothetical protein
VIRQPAPLAALDHALGPAHRVDQPFLIDGSGEVQQIKERRALADIEAGRIRTAITKVKNIWASLPGAGYGQHENDLDRLLSAYLRFGGLLAQENV